MDILLWGQDAFSFGEKPWHIPDKLILKFGAVAIPLAYLAGDLMHPTEGITLKEIAARFDSQDVHLRADMNIA
jgi:7,8-dihydro-6-hydroxymethylpterin-pyrophosphokinase